MSIAALIQRGNELAAEANRPATEVITTSPVLSAPSGPNVSLVISEDRPPMLNANRPVDTTPAPTIAAPAASVPALQSVGQTLGVKNFDWKKYLPILLIVLALLALFIVARKRKSA